MLKERYVKSHVRIMLYNIMLSEPPFSLKKQPTFWDATTGFPAKWSVRAHTDDINANISRVSSSNWLKQISLAAEPIKSTIHADLSSYMSSVWNFCTHSSDFREPKQQWQWWLWKRQWKREFALLQTLLCSFHLSLKWCFTKVVAILL